MAEGMPEEANEDVKEMDHEETMTTEQEPVAVLAEEAPVADQPEEATASTSEVVQVDTLNSDVEAHVKEQEIAAAEETGEATEEKVENTSAEIFEVPDPGDQVVTDAPVNIAPAPVAGCETVETVEEHHLTIIRKLETTIAELNEKLAGYDEMKAELEQYRAEAAEREHTAKVAKAEAYAVRLGLDITVAEVREAVDALDYEKIADMVMASTPEEEKTTEPATVVASVNFEEMKIDLPDNTYGGLISNV